MKDKKMISMLSLKHMLVLSVALNLGLISRLFYECEQSFQRFCLGEKQSRQRSMEDNSSGKEVHFNLNTVRSATATAPSSAHGGGDDGVINLDHGDPTMYENFWEQKGDKTTVVIEGWQHLSYFSDIRNICWFLEPNFASAIIRLHSLVGNAITDDRYIVVGTGSSQLYQAALYALSTSNATEPTSVVSAAPFYSSYPLMTDYLKSGLYKWAGDANHFIDETPYIELVTSPNNPDGSTREAVVNRDEGMLIHDLAYYWPQYTPISSPANHGIMLFTVSKSTGHAGTRIGWALVKDKEVAKRMTKFIELNTIGVSKDSQIRAAKILQAVSDSLKDSEPFFEFGYNIMEKRWKQLRTAVSQSKLVSLPDFPEAMCRFTGRTFRSQPAFAWLKCEAGIEDCERFLRSHKLLTRSGKHFGVGSEYVRASMVDRDEKFNLFIKRLSAVHSTIIVK